MKWLSWQSASYGSIETELDPSGPHTRAESGSMQASSRPWLARELSWISKFPVEWETLPQNEQCGWLLRNGSWGMTLEMHISTHAHTSQHLCTQTFLCVYIKENKQKFWKYNLSELFFSLLSPMDCILELLLLTQVYRAWRLVLYSKFSQYAMMVGWLLMLETLAL